MLAIGIVVSDVFGDFASSKRQARDGPFWNDADRKILLNDTVDRDVRQVLAVVFEVRIEVVGYVFICLIFLDSVPLEVAGKKLHLVDVGEGRHIAGQAEDLNTSDLATYLLLIGFQSIIKLRCSGVTLGVKRDVIGVLEFCNVLLNSGDILTVDLSAIVDKVIVVLYRRSSLFSGVSEATEGEKG
ncbi:hypothetical protein D3C76_1108120 [compost metagenome]